MSAIPRALEGLKVIEFGGYAAGPHIGKILANHGAAVVHVESRDRPDGFRLQYPPFAENRPGINRGGCFSFFNDSKYGVTIDLKKPEGVQLARRLVRWGDLIVENMRPGVMDRLGLGYPALAEINPRLVMLSTCNMGQTGPRADTPGFGSQLSALAGMCGMTGFADGPPMLLYGPYIDFIASTLGTSAALAAVIRSRRTGKGALVDVSQYECGLIFMAGALQDYFANGHLQERCGNDDREAAPHGVFPCSDGEWVTLSCWSDAEFRRARASDRAFQPGRRPRLCHRVCAPRTPARSGGRHFDLDPRTQCRRYSGSNAGRRRLRVSGSDDGRTIFRSSTRRAPALARAPPRRDRRPGLLLSRLRSRGRARRDRRTGTMPGC
jgi:benzylsuccinate CoA-transferase BbsF subunit